MNLNYFTNIYIHCYCKEEYYSAVEFCYRMGYKCVFICNSYLDSCVLGYAALLTGKWLLKFHRCSPLCLAGACSSRRVAVLKNGYILQVRWVGETGQWEQWCSAVQTVSCSSRSVSGSTNTTRQIHPPSQWVTWPHDYLPLVTLPTYVRTKHKLHQPCCPEKTQNASACHLGRPTTSFALRRMTCT